MDEPLTPEQERAKTIAELRALPIQPLKPIPLEMKEEIMREMEWESDEEYAILMFNEMQEFGSCSGDELLAMLDGKELYWPPLY